MWSVVKVLSFVFIILAWIILTFFFLGCANVDKVEEEQGWFPVGMDEDDQGFYNSKYNSIDNGYKDPNAKLKIFNTKY